MSHGHVRGPPLGLRAVSVPLPGSASLGPSVSQNRTSRSLHSRLRLISSRARAGLLASAPSSPRWLQGRQPGHRPRRVHFISRMFLRHRGKQPNAPEGISKIFQCFLHLVPGVSQRTLKNVTFRKHVQAGRRETECRKDLSHVMSFSEHEIHARRPDKVTKNRFKV